MSSWSPTVARIPLHYRFGWRLRFGIKDLGDASHALQTVTPETRVLIEGPYGEFFERRFPQRDMLWLGGGIGITPFVGGAWRGLRSPAYSRSTNPRRWWMTSMATAVRRCAVPR